MSVKALLIEGGETVIADVQEVHDKQKQEFLGYRVKDLLKILDLEELSKNPGSLENKVLLFLICIIIILSCFTFFLLSSESPGPIRVQ